MAVSLEEKRAVIESRSRIRELVFGVQDGLMSTVGLLAGNRGRLLVRPEVAEGLRIQAIVRPLPLTHG